MLTATDLWKTYSADGKSVEALRGVSLSINKGEVLALLGPNGAGKTTAIKTVVGLVTPDRGSVQIQGEDPAQRPQVLRHIGAVLEGNRNLYWRLTPLENLEYFGALKGLKRKEALRRGGELLERMELARKRNTPVQALSRGMQQKVAITVALVHRPRLLLLDEPTLGLDVEAAQGIKRLIREMVQDGMGVLLTTHQLDVAEELSHRIAIIRRGRIIVEEPTSKLIRRFSGKSYSITLEKELDAKQLACALEAGAVFSDGKLFLRGNVDALYRLLHALRPAPLLKIERDEATLADVFMKLMKETPDAKFDDSRV